MQLIFTDKICVDQSNRYNQCSILLTCKLLISLVLFLGNSQSLCSQCNIKNTTFKDGEKLNYTVYYNWGLIWVNAGKVSFEVKSAVLDDQKVFHFDSFGKSHSAYDWIFKVRDSYQSYASMDSLTSLKFHRQTHEGGFIANNKYIFDHNKNLIYSFVEDSDHPYKEDTLELPDCTYDILTAAYVIRNYNFLKYEKDEKIPISVVIDNKVHNLYFRYRTKATIETRKGDRYNCIKFTALLLEGSLFKGGEDLVVWVTDDENRIPVLIEAKIVVGSVKVYLDEVTGIRTSD